MRQGAISEAELFYRDLVGSPSRRTASFGEFAEDDWSPDKERVFKEWWKKVGGFEGSYADWAANAANKADRGGETNWGITWGTYQNVVPGATKDQFKAMTLDQAMNIARGLYRRYKADQIRNPGVALLISDWQWGGVSKKWVNQALAYAGQPQVAAFGNDGPSQATIDALNAAEPQKMIAALDRARLEAIEADVAKNPKQVVFRRGWRIRVIVRWVQAKLLTNHPGDAARWLNGQSLAHLADYFAHLTSEEISVLHVASLTAPGVGPQSRFAQITKARHEKYAAKSRPKP